jgi:hypothetical protein
MGKDSHAAGSGAVRAARLAQVGAAAILAASLALVSACGALPRARPTPTPAGGIVVVVVTDTPQPAPPAPLVPTVAPPVTPTAVPQPAPTACLPAATITSNARLRSGPGTVYETLDTMPAGAEVQVTARNNDGSWLQIVYEGVQGWVSASLAEAECLDGVPVVSPSPPTAEPGPPAPPADFNLRADSPTLAQGQCTAIRWNVNNVEAVYFFDGQAYRGVAGNDSRSVCPAATTTYRLRVQLNDGSIVEQAITVAVVGQPPPSISFTVDDPAISQGQCTTLRWSVANAQSVYLRDGPNENLVGPNGPVQICPAATNTYVLRVVGRDGRQYQQTIVVTVNAAQRSIAFQASPLTLQLGGCALVSWSVAGDVRNNQVMINLGGAYQTQPPSGSVTFCPPASASAGLEVTWSDGLRDTRNIAIQVNVPPQPTPIPLPAPRQVAIAANPIRITRGQCSLVSWEVTGEVNGQIILRTGQGGGSFDRPVAPAGQEQLCPTATTLYTLLGVWSDGSRFERSVRVEVEGTVEPR